MIEFNSIFNPYFVVNFLSSLVGFTNDWYQQIKCDDCWNVNLNKPEDPGYIYERLRNSIVCQRPFLFML